MERHNQSPPDDFPRLWGVEDKLGLYIPKQKGVLALEGELDISPRRYLSGELKSLFWLRTGRHAPCSSAAKQHRQLLLPNPHCSPSDSPQRQETASAYHYLLNSVKGMDGASVVLLEQIKTIDKRRVVRYIGRVSREQMDGVNEAIQISLGLYIPEEMEAP